jgi:hypothetical protein
MSTLSFRHFLAGLVIGILSLTFAACGGGGGKLEGVYHAASGGPITITIKGSKATIQIAGEATTLDYKVEGNQLKIHDPKQGDIAFTINDDGTLTGQLGLMTKKAP